MAKEAGLTAALTTTAVGAPGTALKPIRNQQVGGSSPPVGSSNPA